MPIAAILGAFLTFLLRQVVVKFVMIMAIAAAVMLLWPIIKELADTFLNFSAIDSALGGLPSGVWYFMQLARVDIGLPMVFGAYVTRFIIRRIPVVG